MLFLLYLTVSFEILKFKLFDDNNIYFNFNQFLLNSNRFH